MLRHLTLALLLAFAVQRATAQDAPANPLSALDSIVGPTWVAHGEGFSSTLVYDWRLDGRILGVTNELKGAGGQVFLRYEGAYMWDPGADEIAFYTVSGGGELHRGRAWLDDNVLWHEAAITGGGSGAYASAMRLSEQTFEFFMITGTSEASDRLFDEDPLVYVPESVDVEQPTEWFSYYAVVLKPGGSSAAEVQADERQAIMNAHIEYQLRLQGDGRSVVAGGFNTNPDGMVGLTLLRVESQVEAEQIANGDPAVEAGLLTATVVEWWVPKELNRDE